jgi:DNA-binding FadR family transcriptional regulator
MSEATEGLASVSGSSLEDASRLHERLSRELATAIVVGRLVEAEQVPTAEELAARFGVSRTVGRETLQALASAGLVSVRHGKRTTVAPMHAWKFMDDLVRHAVAQGQVSPKVATDLRETRIALEVSAVARCARRITQDRAQQLREVARQQVILAHQGTPPLNEIAASDLKFHRLIVEGSDNRILLELVNGLRQQLVTTWAMDTLSAAEHQEAAAEHLAIAEAICSRNGRRAAAALRHHLERAVSLAASRDPNTLDQRSSAP